MAEPKQAMADRSNKNWMIIQFSSQAKNMLIRRLGFARPLG